MKRLALSVAVVLVFAACREEAKQEVSTFRVTGRPSAVALDGDRVWITDDGDSSVHVLQASSGREPGKPAGVERNPVAVTAGGGKVWVAHATGVLTRIDPTTETAQPVRVGRSLTDIAYVSGRLWACDLGSGDILVVHPRTLKVTSRLKAIKPVRIAVASGRVWVTTQDDRLVVLTFTGRRAATLRTGSGPIGVAADSRNVWIANSDDGTVTRVDARTAKLRGRPIHVGHGPVAVAVTRHAVWVANQDDRTVTRIDPAKGRVVGAPVPVDSNIRDAAGSGETLWLVGTDPSRAVRLSE